MRLESNPGLLIWAFPCQKPSELWLGGRAAATCSPSRSVELLLSVGKVLLAPLGQCFDKILDVQSHRSAKRFAAKLPDLLLLMGGEAFFDSEFYGLGTYSLAAGIKQFLDKRCQTWSYIEIVTKNTARNIAGKTPELSKKLYGGKESMFPILIHRSCWDVLVGSWKGSVWGWGQTGKCSGMMIKVYITELTVTEICTHRKPVFYNGKVKTSSPQAASPVSLP